MAFLRFLSKLKTKWNIKKNSDFFLILAAFCLAGSSEGVVVHPILKFFGMTPTTPIWQKVCMYLIFVLPFYWGFLLIYGFFLGQFPFFWGRLKKLGNLLKRAFSSLWRGVAPYFRRTESEYINLD